MRWLALVVLLASSLPTRAAVFAVDTTADAIDATPGDGLCVAFGGGCTLRAAIIESNQLPGADEIEIPFGTYALTIGGAPEDDSLAGDLDVRDDVEIRGAGATSTIISAAAIAGDDAIAANGDFVSLKVRDLALVGGGRGVAFSGYSPVIDVADCIIEGTSIAGIGNIPSGPNSATVTVLRTSIRDNPGAAVSLHLVLAALDMRNSEIARNGGGISFYLNWGDHLIRETLIEDNGGGIDANDLIPLVVEDSIIRRNDFGITTWEGNVRVHRTTIEDNAGAGVRVGGTVLLSHSSVVRNGGGGILISASPYATLEMDTTTVAGNFGSRVGGIEAAGISPLTIRGSTIVGNTGVVAGGIGVGSQGIPGSAPQLTGSIIAQNHSASGASDCETLAPVQGPVQFRGGNVVGAASGCTYTSFESDQIGSAADPIDPLVGPLAMNGGPTPTLALLPGSPAIDTGTDACALTDQRGFQRPIDGNSNGNATCDSGAFEYAAGDFDRDGVSDEDDNCPRVSNRGQQDLDDDGVGNDCDNCLTVANPRVAWNYLRTRAWSALTGGQRDDDRDGFGNKCDAKFTLGATAVGSLDLAQFRASSGRSVSGQNCGTSGTLSCAAFDLDEAGTTIGSLDLARFRAASGYYPGPKCDACPLP